MTSRPLKIAVFVYVILAAIASLVLNSYLKKVTVEVGLDSVSWLPSTATNISYSDKFGWFAYECDMSEMDFVSWTKSDELKPSEIVSPVSIHRYTRILTSPQRPRTYKRKEVSQGLHVQNLSSGGSGYDLVFDRDEKRVYYYHRAR